jgi:uncharacterized protein
MSDPMDETFNDTLNVTRATITPSNFSRPYWEATRDKKLLLQYCPTTGRYQFFPRPVSQFTARRRLEWREASGHGRLYSFTVAAMGPGNFKGHTPYVVALVELDEGVRIISNLLGVKGNDIHIGMGLKPYWLPLPEGTHLLLFQPDAPRPI